VHLGGTSYGEFSRHRSCELRVTGRPEPTAGVSVFCAVKYPVPPPLARPPQLGPYVALDRHAGQPASCGQFRTQREGALRCLSEVLWQGERVNTAPTPNRYAVLKNHTHI
jgi:hypothetical protein